MQRPLPDLEIAGLKRRLAKGSVQALIVQVVAVGLAFLSQLVLTRTLGSAGYGIYAFVFAWVTVLARFCTFGFDISVLRFVAAYRSQALWGAARGVIRYAERRVMIGGAAIFVAAAAVLLLGDSGMSRTLRDTFVIGFAVVPLWALLRVRSSIVRALGGVLTALAPDRAVREGTLVVLICVATFGLSWSVGPTEAMMATLAGTLTGLIVVTLAARRYRSRLFGSEAALADESAEWRRAIVPLVVAAGAQLLLSRMAIVMTGWMIGTTEAGFVALAANLAVLVSFPQTIINTMFMPTIAMLFKRGDHEGLQAITTTATRWICLAALAIVIPLMIGAELVLALFGSDFVGAAPVFRILLVGQLINAAAGPVLQIMNMTGRERDAAWILVWATAGGLVLNLALIVNFGTPGAASATTLTLIGWNVAMAVFVYRRLGVLPSVFGSTGRSHPAV